MAQRQTVRHGTGTETPVCHCGTHARERTLLHAQGVTHSHFTQRATSSRPTPPHGFAELPPTHRDSESSRTFCEPCSHVAWSASTHGGKEPRLHDVDFVELLDDLTGGGLAD